MLITLAVSFAVYGVVLATGSPQRRISSPIIQVFRSACDRNGEVGLRMPVPHPACLTGAVLLKLDPVGLGMSALGH